MKKTISLVGLISLLLVPMAHVATIGDAVQVESEKAAIVSVLERMLPVELECERDAACDPAEYLTSPQIEEMISAFSVPLSDSTDATEG